MQEAQLVGELQNGDLAAFDSLFQKYKNEALRTACLITGDYARAEDVVQETFLTCFLEISKLKNPAAFRSWFYRILTRKAWQLNDKLKKETPADTLPETTQQPSLLEDYIRTEEDREVWQAIAELNEKHRTVVVLYYYNQLSIREIAMITHSLEGTVKSRLHTARKQLGQLLSQKNLKKEAYTHVTYHTI